MRLSTAIRHFEEQLRADGKSTITREVYVRDLKLLQKWLGRTVTIESITPLKLRRFINSRVFSHTRAGNSKAPVSLNRSKSAIRTFFRFLTEAGYLQDNPARLVKLARAPKKPPRPMTSADANRFLSAIKKYGDPLSKRDYLMFRLMLATGIRLGALVRINVDDFDVAGSAMRIRTKGDLEQVVHLSRGLAKELRRHVKRRSEGSAALFQSQGGGPLRARQVQIRFSQWVRVAGIQQHYTVHSLRHSFAARLYGQTHDIRLVQRALGHARVTTTEIYATAEEAAVHQAVRKLACASAT